MASEGKSREPASPNPCPCTLGRQGTGGLLDELSRIRASCPALSLILIPDSAWDRFRALVQAEPDDARHNAIVFLALERGQLGRVTSPVHRYLLDGNALKGGLRRNYVEDLCERWLIKKTELERHQRAKGYMGKLVELLYAEWLESQGAKVLSLEAFRDNGPDIEAEDAGEVRSIEVKYLGREDADFEAIVQSLKSGKPTPVIGDLYGSINYVVFRIYEAAKQLQKTPKAGRTVAFVVDDTTWHTVGLQIQNKWIDWRAAKFLGGAGQKSMDFLDRQRGEYPDLDGELASMIRGLQEIRFLRLVDGLKFIPEFAMKLPGG